MCLTALENCSFATYHWRHPHVVATLMSIATALIVLLLNIANNTIKITLSLAVAVYQMAVFW